jgi:hypothetical protein
MLNVYDPKTHAIANPEYNFLNVGKIIWKQTYERIQTKQYPDYITEYRDHFKITDEDIEAQFELVADVIDGLLERKFDGDRLLDEPYLTAALRLTKWKERLNWKAMAVFDMIANQGTLAYWFCAAVAHFQQPDINAQDPGSLKNLIHHKTKDAFDKLFAQAPEKSTATDEENAENKCRTFGDDGETGRCGGKCCGGHCGD